LVREFSAGVQPIFLDSVDLNSKQAFKMRHFHDGAIPAYNYPSYKPARKKKCN